jgi:Protein of unknown function (DUF4242)
MPRYMVVRTFPQTLQIPTNAEGQKACLNVVGKNAELGVTWIHSYFTEDNGKSYCIYDGPNPDAIRAAAERNGLPCDSVTPVRVLDPYFYLPSA